MLYRYYISLLFCGFLHAEFLLYKVDPIDPSVQQVLNYQSMSGADRQFIIDVYKNTIRKWAPPFCFALKPEDRTDLYVQALHEPEGLLRFLDTQARNLSSNRYGVTWISTTIYELLTLRVITMSQHLITSFARDIARIGLVTDPSADQIGTSHEVVTFDIFKNLYTTDGYMSFVYFSLNDTALNVKRSGNPEMLLDGFLPSLDLEQNPTPLYNTRWKDILLKYMACEVEALQSNQFLLSRGSRGLLISSDKVYLDYELGNDIGLSYGYSLFAGTFFDRKGKKIGQNIVKGARSLDFIVSTKIGYVLSEPIHSLFNQKILYMPYLSTLEGLFGDGEYFHPRIALDKILGTFDLRKYMTDLLSRAKLLVYGNRDDRARDREELFFGLVQEKHLYELEEEQEIFELVILPYMMQHEAPTSSEAQKWLSLTPESMYYRVPDAYLKFLPIELFLKHHIQFTESQKRLLLLQYQDLSTLSPAHLFFLSDFFSELTRAQVQSFTTSQLEDIFNHGYSYSDFSLKLPYISEEQFKQLDPHKIPSYIYSVLKHRFDEGVDRDDS